MDWQVNPSVSVGGGGGGWGGAEWATRPHCPIQRRLLVLFLILLFIVFLDELRWLAIDRTSVGTCDQYPMSTVRVLTPHRMGSLFKSNQVKTNVQIREESLGSASISFGRGHKKKNDRLKVESASIAAPGNEAFAFMKKRWQLQWNPSGST